MATLDDRLLPVFARQHWLASLDDVRKAGGSPSSASRRVASGRWTAVESSVFHLTGAPRTWESTVLAPVLAAGPAACASHLAAAALHGIPGYAKGVPEITIPRGTDLRRSSARIHTSTDLCRCQRVVVDGVPTTDIARTLLDLARLVGDRRLLRGIEWCRRERLLEWGDLVATLARHARKGRPGIRRLRRVIAANADRAEVTDSDLELFALAMIAESGLPAPVLHHRVLAEDRFVAEVDLAYPQWRIAIELDGSVHLQAEVRERDLPRQNDLILEGWTVLRFSWKRLADHPDRCLAEIRAALRTAGARW
jgi:hypothetical protein